MTDIPTTVKVGTVNYRVTTDRDEWIRFEHSQHNRRHEHALGYTHHLTAVIFLNPELAADVTRQTLWHEVLHALHYVVLGGPDWHGLGKEPSDREETVIASWEYPTLRVLQDNPDLVRYLTGKSQTHDQKYASGGLMFGAGDSDPLPPYIPTDGESVINSNGDLHRYSAADKRFHYLGRAANWAEVVESLAESDKRGDCA